jgi:hypothetical protein
MPDLRAEHSGPVHRAPPRRRHRPVYRKRRRSFDNALAENLWSTLKMLIYWTATTFALSRPEQRPRQRCSATSTDKYNPHRIQAGLDGPSPDDYEQAGKVNQPHPQPATLQPDTADPR